jgi:hypothetical protein
MVRVAFRFIVSLSLLSLCPLLCAQNAPPRIRQVGAFEQYIVYWTSEPGWRTELQLRNIVFRLI